MSLAFKQYRFRPLSVILLVALLSPVLASAAGVNYYLSPNGSDAKGVDGSAAHPWLTPNHALNCGDVIIAEGTRSSPSYYESYNFYKGQWGTVNEVGCPGGINVAWLSCQEFDGCIISSGGGMWVDQSYWGVQGWQVTSTLVTAGCFSAAPTGSASIHHIIFANNIADNCMGGGFTSFNSVIKVGTGYTPLSVDYLSIIGNIAFDAARDSSQCYSGISVYQPMNTDPNGPAPGTHIYVAGNFSYSNKQPPCFYDSQTKTTIALGADGIIFDTFDGSQGGYYGSTKVIPTLPVYLGGALADNNVVVGNQGNGLAVQNNGNGTTGQNESGGGNAAITVRHNTSWNNNVGTATNSLCGEIVISTGRSIQEYSNIAATNAQTGCGGYPIFAVDVFNGDNTDYVANNVIYSPYSLPGQPYYYYDSYYPVNNSTFSFGSNTEQDPSFYRAAIPGALPPAPSCSGFSSVPACMGTVVTNFAADNTAAKYLGYQVPSVTAIHDPLYPHWMCNVPLPQGLVSEGCK